MTSRPALRLSFVDRGFSGLLEAVLSPISRLTGTGLLGY